MTDNSESDSKFVSQSFKKRKRLPKGKRLIYAVVIISLILVAVAAVIYKRSHTSKTSGDQEFSYQDQLSHELSSAQKAVASNKTPTDDKAKEKQASDYVALGNALLNKDQPKEAIDAFKKALELSGTAKQEALGGLVSAYDANNQPSEAIKSAEELIAYLKTLPQDNASVLQRIRAVQNDLDRLKSGQKL